MSAASYTILQAMSDPRVWEGWFKDRASWTSWRGFLSVLFGLPLSESDFELFRRCTGRHEPAVGGYREVWLCCGRRAGKSFVLSVVAVFLAVFCDWRPFLSPGEIGRIIIIATDRKQASVIHKYCRALLTKVPSFAELIEKDLQEEIALTNGISIEIHSGSFRGIRGFTCVAALLDEISYWRTDEGAANPDAEILAALRPTMATIPNAVLLAASSPYSRRGSLWEAYKAHYGNDGSPVLCWHAPTRVMNPSVPQQLIDRELEKDPARAAAEYMAEFRSDIDRFVRPEVVEAAVVPGRYELPPVFGTSYTAFCDPSGAASDAMTLAISHAEFHDGQYYGVLDLIREVRPPFSPEATAREFADILHDYRISQVTGDRYSGEWAREQFRKRDIAYIVSEKPKSEIYAGFLAPLNSGRIVLLDHPRMVSQLCSLERRTGRGTGKDVIDHAPHQHDDIANAIAGSLLPVTSKEPWDITDEMLSYTAAHLTPRRPRLEGRSRRYLAHSALF